MNRRDALKTIAITSAAAATMTTLNADTVTMNTMKMKVQDPENPTDFELKHLPAIEIGDEDDKGYTMVKVTIGQDDIIHPSTPDHWIDYIELYADGRLVGKANLEPVISRGFAAFAVKLEGVKYLKAVELCNLHGIWETTKKID